MAAVRAERGLTSQAVPSLCVLDFDGDLSDQMRALMAVFVALAPVGRWFGYRSVE
jgi:hypothetical protein